MLPMPMPPITIRSLAGGRSSLPKAVEGITAGAATAAPATLRNSRREGWGRVPMTGPRGGWWEGWTADDQRRQPPHGAQPQRLILVYRPVEGRRLRDWRLPLVRRMRDVRR